MKNIVFYGPFGGKEGKHIGGGESGNRRTRDLLKELGCVIFVIEKPYLPANKIAKAFVYPFTIFSTFFRLICLVLFRKIDSVHVSGFYGNLIYSEYLIVLLGKLFGCRVVYEVRAGGALDFYRNRSCFYRIFFRHCLRSASDILSQGLAQIDEFKKIAGSENIHYYPNFVSGCLADFDYDLKYRERDKTVRLIYFGRISKAKNLEFILLICSHLDIDFELDIIGSGELGYIEQLLALRESLGLSSKVNIHPAASQIVLKEFLRRAHFFIFPSKEPREGHSNALTEAMSQGVVPVVSNFGFNSDVVGNSYLVVEEFLPDQYAAVIEDIWRTGSWGRLSNASKSRVEINYVEANVKKVLSVAHNLYCDRGIVSDLNKKQ